MQMEAADAALSAKIGGNARTWRGRPFMLSLLWLLPVPVVGFLLFSSTGQDDSYITYWVADQLRRTGRLSNYNGKALEQSSSLLHVLLLAGVSLVTRLPVTTVAPWMAIVAGASCAPVAYWLGKRLDARAGWTAAAFVGTSAPLLYWSFGGLETSLATLLVLLALLVMINAIEGSSTSKVGVTMTLFAVVLVRPEMGLVFVVGLVIATAAVRFLVPASWSGQDGCDRGTAARRVFLAAVAVAGCAILVALFRKVYFGAWMPRPVSVKTGTADIQVGYRYAVNTLVQSRTFIAVVVGAVVVATRRRALTPGWIIAGALVATGTVAVIEPGGDRMECGRLLAPWIAVTLILVAASLGRLSASPRVAVACVLIVANAAGVVTYAERYSTGVAAWTHLVQVHKGDRVAATLEVASASYWERRNVIHAWDSIFIHKATPVFAALERVTAPRRLVYASARAGMVVYYLQKDAIRRGQPFRFIDQVGLVDNTWDRCRQGVSSTRVGKPVSWNRALSGRCGPLPDVISGIPTTGIFGLASVKRRYVLVDFQNVVIRPAAWPRREGGRGFQWLAVRRDLVPRLRTELRREGKSR
jgi:hypothetical protein